MPDINKHVKAVVFDLDGTLLDTLDDLTQSVNHALSAKGMPVRKREEVRRFLGNGVRNLIRQAVPEGTAAEDYESAFQAFRAHYVDHCLDRTAPYPEIPQLLSELKRRDYAMAIVSNKLQPAVTELAQRFFHKEISIAIGERPGIRRKPEPDSLLLALKELECGTDEAIYVGDSEVDLLTARHAQVKCISALWGFRDEAFLYSMVADMLVYKPLEILELLP